MTGVLKDFIFAITYLDDIIIFSRPAEEHLSHIKQVFEKLKNAHLSMKLSKCHFFTKGDPVPWTHPLHQRYQTSTIKNPSDIQHTSTKTAKQVCAFLGLIRYYRKFFRNFAKMAKPLTLLTHQKAKFEWTPIHHTAFLTLEESVIQAPILHYLDPTHRCIGWCMWSTTITRTWWNFQ